MEKVVETTALSKGFRDFWGRTKVLALDKLELTIYRGEIFGLLGPNGSGKTTTLKLLLGLLFPTKGKIKILGRSPQDVANKKAIGFLPEESYLYPYQNAEESLFFYGRLFGLPRDICAKRVKDLLEMVGLTKARTRLLKEYSKGMARRIGIAQALIGDPDLIFLDEPTTGLDPIGTKEIKDLISHLKQCGKTIVLSSHLLADVEDICDRIAILYGGRLLAQGTVAELLTQANTTQIAVQNMKDTQRQELASWLKSKQINASIEQPREKLETFFLRVIQQARSQQVPTSGAEAGSLAASFFQPQPNIPTPNAIIQELLSPQTSNLPTAESTPPQDSLPHPVLQNLLPTTSENATATPPPANADSNKNNAPAQQHILKQLLSSQDSSKE